MKTRKGRILHGLDDVLYKYTYTEKIFFLQKVVPYTFIIYSSKVMSLVLYLYGLQH